MNIKHTPEPTRYGFCGKYLQEQSNGEYIKACHYDVIKQQRDELLEAIEEYGQHAMSCSVTMWPSTAMCDCGFFEAIAKARAA